jgi:hypothetical protein
MLLVFLRQFVGDLFFEDVGGFFSTGRGYRRNK